MKRHTLVGILLFGAFTAFGQSIGGGVSLFIPQSLYGHGEGSVSVESSLGTGIGLGEYLQVPVGVAYNQVYGLTPVGGGISADGPWIYADSVMAHAGLGTRIPLGAVHIELFGAGAANWNVNYEPLVKNIEHDLSDEVAGGKQLSFTSIDVEAPYGFGWIVGGAVGATFGEIGVDLSASYRHILHDLTISGTYQEIVGSTATEKSYDSPDGLSALLSGLAFGIGGSFSF